MAATPPSPAHDRRTDLVGLPTCGAGGEGGPARPPDEVRAARLRSDLAATGMTPHELWSAHLHLGADLSPEQVLDALAGRRDLTAHEHAVLEQALFEGLPGREVGAERPGRASDA